jgi:tetratricopeptide (TPR) repeat protein
VDGGAYTDGVAYQSLEKINTERVKNGLHPIPPSGSTTGDMQIPVPGNAGVPVLSNNVLTMMRHRLESTVGMIAVPVLNIGRGALIAGTKPTAREALLSCLDEHARAVGMQSSGEGMPYGRSVERHRRQDFSAERSLAELRERFDEAFEGCINALRKFDGDERPISLDGIRSTFATLLWAERDPLPGESAAGRAARVSLSGSMLRIFHMIRHAYLRLFEKDRQRFARYCIAFLLDFLPVMKRETASSLTAAIDQAAPGTILPETPLGAIFRGIKAHQYPDRGMLEAGLFPKEGSGSRHLAQFILSDYYVAMTAQDSKGVTVEPWYMDMLAKSVRPAGSYSWFVRRCFALLRVVDDDLIDRRFLEALDRDAASILGAVRSGVHSQAAQFFLLYGNNGRSFDFVNMMVADPALTERKSILLGNAYFVAGKIDLALKAYEEAGMAGENLPDDDWRITPPGLELYGAALLISGREKEALAYYLRDGALAPIGAIVFSVLRPDMVEELKDRVVATSSVFNRKVTRILLEAKQAYGTMP